MDPAGRHAQLDIGFVSRSRPQGWDVPFVPYCYWVGSLDFDFLDFRHISFQPAKSSTFCRQIYSTLGKHAIFR